MGSKSTNQEFREAVATLKAAMRDVEGALADLFHVHAAYDSEFHFVLADVHRNTVHGVQLKAMRNHDPRDLDNALAPVREFVAVCNHRLADLPDGDLTETEDPPCIRCGAPSSGCDCPDELVGTFRLVQPVAPRR